MQAYILHCPALGKASPNLMRKLSAKVYADTNEAMLTIRKELDITFELYTLDAFRELWNSPACCTLFPDASFIATIFVESKSE